MSEASPGAQKEELIMKIIPFVFALMLAIPAFGQYKLYSDWLPTNEDGIEYRWQVDDLSPRACTVQFRDLFKDGDTMVLASINYRSLRNRNSERIRIPIVKQGGLSRERVLLSCTFLDHVAVERTTRR